MTIDRIAFEKLKPGTIALVCGSRELSVSGKRWVYTILDELRPTVVLQGGAPGIDSAARDWCGHQVVACAQVDAPWKALGKAAGPVRNGWMLDLRPDVVIAFPGNDGTADMVKQAAARGVTVIEAWPEVLRSSTPRARPPRG